MILHWFLLTVLGHQLCASGSDVTATTTKAAATAVTTTTSPNATDVIGNKPKAGDVTDIKQTATDVTGNKPNATDVMGSTPKTIDAIAKKPKANEGSSTKDKKGARGTVKPSAEADALKLSVRKVSSGDGAAANTTATSSNQTSEGTQNAASEVRTSSQSPLSTTTITTTGSSSAPAADRSTTNSKKAKRGKPKDEKKPAADDSKVSKPKAETFKADLKNSSTTTATATTTTTTSPTSSKHNTTGTTEEDDIVSTTDGSEEDTNTAEEGEEEETEEETEETATGGGKAAEEAEAAEGENAELIDSRKSYEEEDVDTDDARPKADTFRAQLDYDDWDKSDSDSHDSPSSSDSDSGSDSKSYGDPRHDKDGHASHHDDSHHMAHQDYSFRCPNESGFFRHPKNCSRFFWCIQSKPTAMFCSEGTAFDPATNVCSWAIGSDGCGGMLAAPTYGEGHPSHIARRRRRTVLDDVKQTDDDVTGVRRHRRQASSGYDYNSDDEKSKAEGLTEGRSFGIASSAVDFEAVPVRYQCPGDGFYADPNDCAIFYHCSNGKPYQHECQPGTAFNQDKLVCSWPVGERGCGGMLGVPYMAQLQDLLFRDQAEAQEYITHLHDNGDNTHRRQKRSQVSEEQAEDSDRREKRAAFQCPDEMESYYPDPESCKMFYMCTKGAHFHMRCANGTAFNAESGVCSWPVSLRTGCGAVLHRPTDPAQEDPETHDPQDKADEVPVAPKEASEKEELVLRRKRATNPLPSWASGALYRQAADEPAIPSAKAEAFRQEPAEEKEGKGEKEPAVPSPSVSKTKIENSKSDASKSDAAIEKVKDEVETEVKDKADDKNKKNDVSGDAKSSSTTATATTTQEVGTTKSQSNPTTKTTATPTSATTAKSSGSGTAGPSVPEQKNASEAVVEHLPGVIDSRQRTSSWPWESVEKADKKSREEFMSEKKASDDVTAIEESKQGLPSSTSQENPESLSMSSNSSAAQSSTVKSSPSTGAPTPKETSSTSKATSTLAPGPKKASSSARPQSSTLAVEPPPAEAYRVAGTEMEFRCPFATGHFRDPMNCAIYYHCSDDVPFRKDCPIGKLYDIITHSCLPIAEVKDCGLVEQTTSNWLDDWLTRYPETESYPSKVVVPDEFECESQNGYFENAEDCTQYVECLDGVPYPRTCMAGTAFDVKRKKCTWNALVPDCRHAADGKKGQEDESDRFQCPTSDGHYPDPDSCSHYWHCIDHLAVRRVCDPNNFFDTLAGRCRWAKLVTNCDDRGFPMAKDKLPISSFECPLPNGHFRDPEHCSVFYHCLAGVPYRGACRRHHAFDVDTLTCVPRHEVPGCEYNHVTSEGQEEKDGERTALSLKDEGSSPVLQSREGELGEDKKGDSDSGFRCPKAHGLYRDPEDCRVFYHCFSGRHFRHECQLGTLFSTERNLCTWPALVPDCQTVTSPPQVTSTAASVEQTKAWIATHLPKDFRHDHQHDGAPPSTSSRPQPVTRATKTSTRRQQDDGYQKPDQSGPKANHGHDNVTPRLDMVTVGGRQQNDGRGVTVTAFDVDVDVKAGVQKKTPLGVFFKGKNSAGEEGLDYGLSKGAPPDVSSSNFIVEEPSPVEDADIEFVCPQIVFDQYFRDPLDCTRFHRCVKGLRFTFSCPRGTFFDPLYNICDFMENVPDCDHEGRRLGTSGRQPLASLNQVSNPVYTGEGREYMSESTPDLSTSSMCPDKEGLFPHPASCNKFVYCVRGTPVVLTCPEDLLYNIETMTCDYKDNIVCVRYD